MKFVELDITGFGPLAGEKFTFVDSMNVVYGPNESAKTTVHAAIFVGLCGLRRGQGQPEREDKAFGSRHRPWDQPDTWEVSTLVELADGRKIRLVQDLVGKTGCKALDDSSGIDLSSEIQFEGAIDGSVWLGLNRRSFRSTACVRQSEIVAALARDDDHSRDHSALEQALQLAATSAGQRDETAAAALTSLNDFWRENVGLDDARSARRPFRRLKAEVEERKERLKSAQEAHAKYVELLAERDEAISQREDRSRQVKLAETAVARSRADLLDSRAVRAEQLHARHPLAPAGVSTDQTLGDQVMEALTLWDGAPPAQSLGGKSSTELEEELATLPERPAGELTPAQEVLDAASDLAAARKMLGQHDEAKPVGPPERVAPQSPAPPVMHPSARTWSRARIPVIAVSFFALAGVVALALGTVAVGSLLLVAAAASAGLSLWFWRTPSVAEPTVVPATLPGLLSAWETQHDALKQQIATAQTELKEVLARHAVDLSSGESVEDGLQRYKNECVERERRDRKARRRDELKLAREQRKRAEEDSAMRERAIAALRQAAVTTGLSETDPEEIAAQLRGWQGERQQGLNAHDEERREWAELEQLLSGRTVEQLKAEADRARFAANAAADGFSAADLDGVDAKSAETELPNLRTTQEEAVNFAARRSQLAESEGTKLKSVAEAEAELEESENEFTRVTELSQTLRQTIAFLQEAQQSVYASIAPILTKTLVAWLPRVAVSRTGVAAEPRYNDVHVDPETLAVRVRLDGGPWRDADVLSAGTKEQIYLLLRIALTEHLVKDGEVVPLLLDEVTAQCDSTRREALLELLLELSAGRQVILFTHEDAVFEWAKANLSAAAVRGLEPVS